MNMIAGIETLKVAPSVSTQASSFDGLFFTRTDDRGVIQSFNQTFLSVSEFSPDQVFCAPHKIVRHEDMPKGAFHLMWSRLKEQKPVGVYVKNRTKSGGSYWVFAVAVPVQGGGYLSVRLSPSTDHFATIQNVYSRVRKAEKDRGLSAEASAGLLLEELAAEGYQGYDLFEAQALSAELTARSTKLGRLADRQLTMMQSLYDAAAIVRTERLALLGLLDMLRLLPTNMRLISHRTEKGLGPLSTLSERYGAMADTLLMQLCSLSKSDDKSASAETDALFHCGISLLLKEAAEDFATFKEQIDHVNVRDEQSILRALSDGMSYEAQVRMALSARSASRLARELEMLHRSILALDSIRVMSRVEFGQMIARSRDLAAVIQKIDDSHKDIRRHLSQLSSAVLRIEEIGRQLLYSAA